ncbi:MAG: deoxyribonuclease V [Anaerolineae bacterium]|nr:deoxyribonuclease V [Anaerolineae bacterium]
MFENKLDHPWDLHPSDAVALQRRLAERVIREPLQQAVAIVGGVDASYRRGIARAAVVALSYPGLELLNYAVATRAIDYPYVPGLLSFREAPAVLEALESLQTSLDLLIFDGHGIAHPRRFGLASHVGLLVDLPTVGCAKSRLCGSYEEPGRQRGDFTHLWDDGEIIGAVLCTRSGVRPVFVSIGHRVDLPTAVAYVLGCGGGYRLPEPTRWAHRIAGGWRPTAGLPG